MKSRVATSRYQVELLEARKLLAAGALDLSFSGDGLATVDFGTGHPFNATDVAVQSDGKTVVVGALDIGSGDTDVAIARLNANGTLDTTFGPLHNGKVTTHFGQSTSGASAVTIQSDGKIVVVGSFEQNSHLAMFVQRYSATGVLEGTRGSFSFNTYTDYSGGADVTMQRDGKIVAVGFAFTASNIAQSGNEDFVAVRLNTDLSLDNTFAGDGTLDFGFGGWERAAAVNIDYNGNSGNPSAFPYYGFITIVGNYRPDKTGTRRDLAVGRLKPDGTPDNSFDGDGRLATIFPTVTFFQGRGVVTQPGGKIVVAGEEGSTATTSLRDFALARYLPNGKLDTSFGSDANGLVHTDFGGNDKGNAMVIGFDGHLMVGGTSDSKIALAAYTSNGILDKNFDGDGKVTRTVAGAAIRGLERGPNRTLVAGGGSQFNVERFIDAGPIVSVGSLDSSAKEAGLDPGTLIVLRKVALPVTTRVYLSIGGTATRPGSINPKLIDYSLAGMFVPNELVIGTPYVDILPNQLYAVVTLTPKDDIQVEGTEEATFTILSNVNYDVGTPKVLSISIADNDGTPTPGATLNATADAYVKDGADAAANFGTNPELNVKFGSSGFNRNSYIKFDISSVSNINSVKLQLTGKLSSTAGTNLLTSLFSVSDTSWAEGVINFNNKPASGATALASATIIDNTERLYEFDVTAYVKAEKLAGHNTVSFVLKNSASSSPYVIFNSREAGSGQPKLVVA